MKRLYYLTDSIEFAHKISDTVHQQGISNWHFHIMSKNKDDLKNHHLHRSNFFIHERDCMRIAERGAIIGLLVGFLFTLWLVGNAADIPSGTLLWIIAAMTFVSATIGALGVAFGLLYGLAFENVKVRRFHKQLEDGQYLLMIDVRKEDAEDIRNCISVIHGSYKAGEDYTLISPFQTA